MARSYANTGRIYRAVVVVTHASGETTTLTYGPYDKPSTAQGVRTQVLNERACHPSSAVGHIESAEVVWTREAP